MLRNLIHYIKCHPFLSIGEVVGFVVAVFAMIEAWNKLVDRLREKRIKHYCREIRKTQDGIAKETITFQTTQEALASIPLLRKGDELLRNEAYRRVSEGEDLIYGGTKYTKRAKSKYED